MNKDIFEGTWEQLKGRINKFWGELTDDDLKQIEGNQQEIFGKLQERYGYTKEEAKKAIEDFKKSID
jgi:uncharacterized protein YjbJ (UPF0337 family)